MPTIVLCEPHCQCADCSAGKRLLFAAGPLPLGNDERSFTQLVRKRRVAHFKAQFEAFQRGEFE